MPKPIQHPGLRALCAKHDYTLRDLSLIFRCERQAIRYYLKGRKSPRLEQRLAQEFNLTVAELRTALGINQN